MMVVEPTTPLQRTDICITKTRSELREYTYVTLSVLFQVACNDL